MCVIQSSLTLFIGSQITICALCHLNPPVLSRRPEVGHSHTPGLTRARTPYIAPQRTERVDRDDEMNSGAGLSKCLMSNRIYAPVNASTSVHP